MLDFLTPGHQSSSPTDVLIQVATLAGGLLIAAALRFGLEAIRRKRAARNLRNQHLTAEFYRRPALGGDRNTLIAILDQAPDADPVPGDEL